MKELQNKKGQIQLGDIPNVVQILVVIAVFLAVGALVLSKIGNSFTANSSEANITQDGLEGLNEMSSFQATWAIVLAAAVLIGIVATAIFVTRR